MLGIWACADTAGGEPPEAKALSEFEPNGAAGCFALPPRVSIRRVTTEPVTHDVEARYEVSITNESIGCAPEQYAWEVVDLPGSSVTFVPPPPLRGGETAQVAMSVLMASDESEPGIYAFRIGVWAEEPRGPVATATSELDLRARSGCGVSARRELLINSPRVVGDRIRAGNAPLDFPSRTVWHLEALLREASVPLTAILEKFTSPQTVNGFVTLPREHVNPTRTFYPTPESGARSVIRKREQYLRDHFVGPYSAAWDGAKLLAIVNRMDQRDLAAGHAGMVKFVYGLADTMAMSLEYELPARTSADVIAWANAFHQLGRAPFPSEQYNALLAALTTRITHREGAAFRGLRYLRVLEITSGHKPEFRQFEYVKALDEFAQVPVSQTPDGSFKNTPLLATYVNEHADSIVRGEHQVPHSYRGVPFLGASADAWNIERWEAPGIVSADAQRAFALHTCTGCHTRELGSVQHLSFRLEGSGVDDPQNFSESKLSEFLAGPHGRPEQGDLARRVRDFEAIVCPNAPLPEGAAREAFLSRGLRRVH